jgi:hypothetical protein
MRGGVLINLRPTAGGLLTAHLPLMSTPTHTLTHPDTPTHTPTHTLTHPDTPTHTHTHPDTPTHTHTHPHTPTHTLTHPDTPTHTHTHPDTPTHTHTHPHTPRHTQTHPHTPSHRHTHPHTPRQTNNDTSTCNGFTTLFEDPLARGLSSKEGGKVLINLRPQAGDLSTPWPPTLLGRPLRQMIFDQMIFRASSRKS